MVVHQESAAQVRRPPVAARGFAVTAFPDDVRHPAFYGPLAKNAVGDRTMLAACGVLLVLFCLRMALAAWLPLSFDEAYYWLWSKHLALGYYEHPAAIALAIRAGTAIFGDSEWGVRAVPMFLSLWASWAVWRSAAILLPGKHSGAIACLLFNSMLMVAAETMGATPDSLLITAAALLLWSVAKLQNSADGRWWLAAGAAAGLAISVKYTGFFLGGSILVWLLVNTTARRWLRTVWPYAGALIAILFFAPTFYWNATHGFASFGFQFGRIGAVHANHLMEFVDGQIALASPFILVLAAFGLARNPPRATGTRSLSFAAAIVWLPLLFFPLHALHDRVQGNWPCFAYPALALLAAQTFVRGDGTGMAARILAPSRWLAFPAAALILVVAYAQAFFGMVPIGRRDPIARMMGVGFAPVAQTIAAEAADLHARAIVTTNYSAASWLSFYLHAPLSIVQITDERRLLSAPPATAAELTGTLLYVTADPRGELPAVLRHFSRVKFVATLVRARNGNTIDSFYSYQIAGFHGDAIGRVPRSVSN